MTTDSQRLKSPDFLKIIERLSELPRTCGNQQEALDGITRLGLEAMGGQGACSLTFVHLDTRYLELASVAGFDEQYQRVSKGRRVKMGSLEEGSSVDFETAARGKEIERYDIEHHSSGLASDRVVHQYGLKRVRCFPLWLKERLIGYLNFFDGEESPFTEAERSLHKIFAHFALLTLEQFSQRRMLTFSLNTLSSLSRQLVDSPPREPFQFITEKTCELLDAPCCVLWQMNERKSKLRPVAMTGISEAEFERLEVTPVDLQMVTGSQTITVQAIDRGEMINHWGDSEQVSHQGWRSLMSAPVTIDGRLCGMLDLFTREPRLFSEWEKAAFLACVSQATLAFLRAEHLTSRKRLGKLNEIMSLMTKAQDIDELLQIVLNKSMALVGCERGLVSRLEYDLTGPKLRKVFAEGDIALNLNSAEFGVGITGKSLSDETIIRVDDISDPEYATIYREYWPGTRSEIAIPILIPNAEIRCHTNIDHATKPFGVLNLESPRTHAFSKADSDILWSLVSHAAIIIEKLSSEHKRAQLAKYELEIADKEDQLDIIHLFAEAIAQTLEFPYVNVSIVDKEQGRIRTEHVIGLHEDEVQAFKHMADHSLESDDIQACIVRTGNIEVPDSDDPRLDPRSSEFTHQKKYIRLFMPMVVLTSNECIGTVEVGYDRRFRKYIYEEDVQILRHFVAGATRTMEKKRRGILDIICHELRSPIVGIQNNASHLQRRWTQLPQDHLMAKLGDILLDCSILSYQVIELERFLGRKPSNSHTKRAKTLLYRDLVKKTLTQYRSLLTAQGLDPDKVFVHANQFQQIPPLFIDTSKANQVLHNLITNAMKYAESDRDSFRVEIEAVETKNSYIVKMKDWGIGIDPDIRKRVFEHGFRAPLVVKNHIAGSGLGLSISRSLMREMGGDLVLEQLKRPTEFHLIFPKKLAMEAEAESHQHRGYK